MKYNPSMPHIITHELRKLAECKTSNEAKSIFKGKTVGVKTIDAEGKEKEYYSMSELARELGINCQMVKSVIGREEVYKGFTISYTGKNRAVPERANTAPIKVVTVDAQGETIIYKSKAACAEALGVDNHIVYWAINKGKQVNGLSVSVYREEKKKIEVVPRPYRYKPCKVTFDDGKEVICKSVKEAADIIGVSYDRVTSAMHRGLKTKGAKITLLKKGEQDENK